MIQNSQKTSFIDSLPLLKYGNSLLRKKVCPIDDFTIIPEMVEQMYETLSAENWIGLVANELGWNFNLLVIDTRNYEEEDGEEKLKPSLMLNTSKLR